MNCRASGSDLGVEGVNRGELEPGSWLSKATLLPVGICSIWVERSLSRRSAIFTLELRIQAQTGMARFRVYDFE